jgi:glycosyltransferase involved in cell wall biosynthesis
VITNLKSRNFVLAAVALPPPVHGQALVNQAVVTRLKQDTQIEIVNLSSRQLKKDLRYHLVRMFAVAKAVHMLFEKSRENSRIFYTVVEAGNGIIYTLLLVAFARLLNYRVFLHHHASNYLLNFKRSFQFLLKYVGPHSVHIVGSPWMARDLQETYDNVNEVYISTNVCHITPGSKLGERVQPRIFTLGFLSNMMMSKGLGRALAVAINLKAAGVPVKLVLAGPLIEDEGRKAIDNAKSVLGNELVLLGSVSGAAKDAFFRSIDVFLFPTTYRHETHGLVIFEAMSYGLPIIVNDAGYTAEFSRLCGVIIPSNENYVDRACSIIQKWMAEPSLLVKQSKASTDAFNDLITESRRQYETLICYLRGVAPVEVISCNDRL